MFITLEGGEGSGKSVQVEFIKNFFLGKKKEVLVTKEPGGTDIGRKLRKILLSPESKNLSHMAELLLYLADRSQHLKEVIIPALKSNKIVICDRFFDSTVVYQSFVRGLDLNLINTIHNAILEGIEPDLTILLDVDPKIGLLRAKAQIQNGQRSVSESRFEDETLKFHQKVREGFLALSEKNDKRFKVVDASKTIEEVRNDITSIFKNIVK